MRRLLGMLVVLLMLAGCTVERVGGDPERTEAPTGPVDLAVPIEVARVVPEPAPTASVLPDPDGVPLNVEEPFLTITRLDHAATDFEETAGTWSLQITLTPEDGEVFSQWTSDHTGEQAAMIVDGEVVFAPTIQAPIPGREITITAQYTQDEATSLLNKLTGR